MIPFFSVIVPVYNVAPFLQSCLDSLNTSVKLLRSEFPDSGVEFIFIDDGSTDGCDMILDNFKELYRKKKCLYVEGVSIIVKHKKNNGVGAARNDGLDLSSGEWVLFVDSDDVVSPFYFLALRQMIKKHNPDAIRFNYIKVKDHNLSECYNSCLSFDDNFSSDFLAIFKALNSAFPWNICYRRILTTAVRYEESITLGEDVLFSCKMLPYVKNVCVIDAELYHYLHRENSLMHQKEISVLQIESCGISMLGRIESIKAWDGYFAVRNMVYSIIRNTYIGQAGIMLKRVNKVNKVKAWNVYCKYGRQIFGDSQLVIPLCVRLMAYLIYTFEFRMLWVVLLYMPWWMRVLLLRISLVEKIHRRHKLSLKS